MQLIVDRELIKVRTRVFILVGLVDGAHDGTGCACIVVGTMAVHAPQIGV